MSDPTVVAPDPHLLAARCSTPSPAPPGNPARPARRGRVDDPMSGSPAPAEPPTAGSILPSVVGRRSARSFSDTSSAGPPTHDATAAALPARRSELAATPAATIDKPPPTPSDPSVPAAVESPADAAPTPRAAARAAQRLWPPQRAKQHHEFEDRPQGCVHDGKQHSTDYAQPAKILEPRLLSPTGLGPHRRPPRFGSPGQAGGGDAGRGCGAGPPAGPDAGHRIATIRVPPEQKYGHSPPAM